MEAETSSRFPHPPLFQNTKLINVWLSEGIGVSVTETYRNGMT